MHDRSHGVIRMPVHLEIMENVIFEEGNEAEARLKTTIRLVQVE